MLSEEDFEAVITALLDDPRFEQRVKSISSGKPEGRVIRDAHNPATKFVSIFRATPRIRDLDLTAVFGSLLGQKALVEDIYYPVKPLMDGIGMESLKVDDAILMAALNQLDFIRPNYHLEDEFGGYYYAVNRRRPTSGVDRRKCIAMPRLAVYQELLKNHFPLLMSDLEEYVANDNIPDPAIESVDPDFDVLRYMQFLDYLRNFSQDYLYELRRQL